MALGIMLGTVKTVTWNETDMKGTLKVVWNEIWWKDWMKRSLIITLVKQGKKIKRLNSSFNVSHIVSDT